MDIRAAEESDSQAIAEIWNLVIRASVFTFNSVEKSEDEIRGMISEKRAVGHPVLVADSGGVAGFATYGQFRLGVGYVRTMEHTIHLPPGERGKGTGRALMQQLESIAQREGVHSLIAGISGENRGAVAFHAAMGYSEIACLPQVGRKFGRWFDLVLMQKFLAP